MVVIVAVVAVAAAVAVAVAAAAVVVVVVVDPIVWSRLSPGRGLRSVENGLSAKGGGDPYQNPQSRSLLQAFRGVLSSLGAGELNEYVVVVAVIARKQ